MPKIIKDSFNKVLMIYIDLKCVPNQPTMAQSFLTTLAADMVSVLHLVKMTD